MDNTFLNNYLSLLKDRLIYQNAFSALKELQKTQWFEPEKIKEFQWLKMKKLLLFVSRNNPYYRNIFFERRLRPFDLKNMDDLNKLPLLTKSSIRDYSDKLRSIRAFGYLAITSSGSTANPVTVLRDKKCHERILAARWRALGWWGINHHDRSVQVWGKPIKQLRKGIRPITQSILKNCLYLSAFEMSYDNLKDYVKAIITYRPKYIFGYANSIYKLAVFILESGINSKLKDIKLVVSSAEILFTEQRPVIQKAFNCHVANFYNAAEAGLIAAECPSGNMHLTSENIYFEYIPFETSTKNSCKLCITVLDNYKFPLIRYEMDDLVEISNKTCSCGRALPIIKNIYGRTFDLFVSSDKKFIHGAFFCYLIHNVPGVRLYHIIQEDVNLIKYFIVKDSCWMDSNVDYITKNVKYLMGDRTGVEFIFLDRIDDMVASDTGKYKFVTTYVR